MAEQMNTGITDDDRLWAALSYVFSPLIPIIVLLMEDKKNRPYLKLHAVQSLALGVIGIILLFLVVGVCLTPLIFIYQIYLAVQAYNGQAFEIPVVSNFVKNQGWV